MNDLEPKKNSALEERRVLVLDALMGRMDRLDSRMDTLVRISAIVEHLAQCGLVSRFCNVHTT